MVQRANHWHPLLAAVEQEPGLWHLASQTGPYAVVRLIEIGGERGYRATTYAEPRRLIGYRRSLRGACEAAHRDWLRRHGPDPGAEQYPDLSGGRRERAPATLDIETEPMLRGFSTKPFGSQTSPHNVER